MPVDSLGHAALEQLGQRLAGGAAVVVAHSTSSACMAFIMRNAAGRLLIVAACGIGVLHLAGLRQLRGEYPLPPLTQLLYVPLSGYQIART
jgi:hypothetical protein